VIEGKLDQGLLVPRIFQDLFEEHRFAGSYWSVMRFVRRLGQTCDLPCRRIECESREQSRVDFGRRAPVVDRDGRHRKSQR
jgi:hypothetical protein